MKKYLLGILLVAMAIGFSAFTGKNNEATLNMQTYYFTSAKKQITTGQTNSLVQSGINGVTNTAKWTIMDPGYSFSSGDYLAAIVFDTDVFSLSEAITALWSYYAANSNLPADNGTFTVEKGGVNHQITVRRKMNN